jgi:hypothetical protein
MDDRRISGQPNIAGHKRQKLGKMNEDENDNVMILLLISQQKLIQKKEEEEEAKVAAKEEVAEKKAEKRAKKHAKTARAIQVVELRQNLVPVRNCMWNRTRHSVRQTDRQELLLANKNNLSEKRSVRKWYSGVRPHCQLSFALFDAGDNNDAFVFISLTVARKLYLRNR